MLQLTEFERDHVEQAAQLLAARHATDRARQPLLPARFEDSAECRPQIEKSFDKGDGVAALRDGRLMGYLLSQSTPAHDPQRRASVMLGGHAIAAGEGAETYREMYAVLAPSLLRRGIFAHQVVVPSSDELAMEAWFSLSFGERMHVAHRGLEDVSGAEAGVDISMASPEEADDVWDLFRGLGYYNTTSPLFIPDVYDDSAWRTELDKSLQDPATAFWVARQGGQAAAVMYIGPTREAIFDRPEGTANLNIAFARKAARQGGVGTALLRRCVGWARHNGNVGISLDFFTFNILGSRFWLGHGFRPMATILERSIDPRIAWADGTNQ
jgi:GNAT superfamily N-acetyltransferase